MPQEIRILQIADLLIENQASGDYISAAIQEYRRKIKPEEAPDYLVVCGNITKAGEPDQFKAAQTALNDVRNTLFQAAQFPHNRVFIVPGARDLPKLRGGERDSERFGQFYKDFYA
jgi:Icc-related predicted phosphoesterase